MRIGHQIVERQQDSAVGKDLPESRLALAQFGAMGRFDLARPLGIDQGFRSAGAREQDPAFLKRFADRGDPETQGRRVEPFASAVKVGDFE